MWWQVLGSLAVGLVLVWAALVVVLWWVARRYDDPTSLRDVLRLLPDVLRLLRRLAGDPSLPRRVRVLLVVLIVYLVSPVDLIPDVVPVVGYADDAVVVALMVRWITRTAGPEALDRHWPGTPEGLRALRRLTGVANGRDGG